MKFTFAPESRPLEGFTIKRAIYRGGFGEVYYAVSDAGREVALKLLHHNAEIELRGVQQCLNLSHPNLVTIFDVRKDGDGDQWIIMEFVSGDTLDHVIRQHPQGVPIEVIRKWLPGIAAGVTYLHSRGIVHRDLKPANIFSEEGVVKIGDVGLSKFIAPSKRSAQTQSVGTVYYMAPEVAKGRYGREVDTYALGVILYEMLTGQLPFDGESTGEILMKHLSEQPDLTKLPPRLRSVIGKALHKDPQQRHKSIAEFERVFTDAVLGRSQAVDIPEASFLHETKRPPASKPINNHDQPLDVDMVQDQSTRDLTRTSSSRNWAWFSVVLVLITIAVNYFVSGQGAMRPVVFLTLAGGCVAWMMFSKEKKQNISEGTHPQPVPRHMYGPRSKPSAWSSLLSSTFLTVPLTGILTSALALFKPTLFENLNGSSTLDPAGLAFFSTVALSASWAVLGVSQLAGYFGSRWKESRISYALAGVVVGLLAYGLDQFLMFDMSHGSASNTLVQEIGDHRLYSSVTGPTLAGYLVFFTALFGLRNWYSQVAADREKRFSVWTVLLSVAMGWLVTTIFVFPTNWAMAWALIISCVLQLSSPLEPTTAQGRRLVRR